jgi:hypothetical protein
MRKALPLLAVALAAAGPAAAATPAPKPSAGFGFAAGRVTSANGGRLVVQGQNGVTGVVLSGSTAIVKNVAATRGDLVPGTCLVATGARGKNGSVAATDVTLSAAQSGGCGFMGGRFRGSAQRGQGARPRPPAGAQRPPANRAFAAGAVSAVKGDTLKLESARGAATVLLSNSTRITKTTQVGRSAVAVGTCVFVRGGSQAGGAIVTAQSVTVSTPGPQGCMIGFGPGAG